MAALPRACRAALGSAHFQRRWSQVLAEAHVHRRPVRSVNFSRSGSQLCTGSEDGMAKVFELPSGRLLKEVDHHSTIWWSDFSADGALLCTASDDRSVRVYDCETWELVEMFGHGLPAKSASFAPAGDRIATASGDAFLRVFDLDSGHELLKHKHGGWVVSVRYSCEGLLASGCADKWLRVFDGEKVVFQHRFAGLVTCVDFSPDGRLVCASTTRPEDGTHVVDLRSQQRVQAIPQEEMTLSARFSPNGEQIYTVSRTGVRIYEVSTAKLLQSFPHPNVNYASMRADGLLCSCSDDGYLRFFAAGEAASGPELQVL